VRPPRIASALYYHRGTSDLFLSRVDLDKGSVEAVQRLDPQFHGQADMDEAIRLRDICLKHPKVLEKVKRFKLPDQLALVCDTWPYGRDSEDQHPRYVQVSETLVVRLQLLISHSVTCLLARNTQGQIIMISHSHSHQYLI
jgi:primary-amine oxidase